MLPLPEFHFHAPASLDEAVALLARLGRDARVLAGGTDLLPNLKQGLSAPAHLVSLQRVGELRGVRVEPERLVIGAMTPLSAVAAHPDVVAGAAALAAAAAAVGGPQHRRMGTLGGNLCLDTRCRHYNQSPFWRKALGYCLKKDGDVCHVVAGGRRCVAAATADTAAAALALEGVVVLQGAEGQRRVPVDDFFVADGTHNTCLREGELLFALEVPRRPGRASAYEKLRARGAIDFPLLSVAARCDVEAGVVRAVEVVVGALAAKPRRVAGVRALPTGGPVGAYPVEAAAAAALRECHPLPNVEGELAWRQAMVPVLVRRALARAMGGA